jgi:nucleotidyltransferase substrate binding protein (TIGR01987 family)
VRWEQRFSNYNKALTKLQKAVIGIRNSFYKNGVFDDSLMTEDDELVKEGFIQRFEYTHELAWNVIKDFLKAKGNQDIYGSKDATRLAFENGLIEDGHVWMEMINSRNKTSHTYNEDVANAIFLNILNDFYPAFEEFRTHMETLLPKQ